MQSLRGSFLLPAFFNFSAVWLLCISWFEWGTDYIIYTTQRTKDFQASRLNTQPLSLTSAMDGFNPNLTVLWEIVLTCVNKFTHNGTQNCWLHSNVEQLSQVPVTKIWSHIKLKCSECIFKVMIFLFVPSSKRGKCRYVYDGLKSNIHRSAITLTQHDINVLTFINNYIPVNKWQDHRHPRPMGTNG